MAEHSYLNLDLVVETDGASHHVKVVDSPAGEATETFVLPFSADRLENFVLKMGGARTRVRRMAAPPRSLARQFGSQLHDALFTGEVGYCMRQSLAIAQQQGHGLRIRLRLNDAPDLAEVPWEYLHSPVLQRPLAPSTETPLVRYVDMGQPTGTLQVEPPLRVLLMASSPTDIDWLDTRRELGLLEAATADLVRKGQLEMHVLGQPTVAGLQRQLRKDGFHILHFMGHGVFDEQLGGMLAFEDEDGRARPVSGDDLGMMLHDHNTLRMVVLNACEGARTSVQDPLGGVAQMLVRQGIPAVIAMQFEISDGAAVTFAHELYLSIADGYPVDAATSEARKALYLQSESIEWGTPVLHMRADDGRVFEVTASPAPADVDDLLDTARDRASTPDPTAELSAIGVLKRVLALDPGNTEAAAMLDRLQARTHDGAADEAEPPATTGHPPRTPDSPDSPDAPESSGTPAPPHTPHPPRTPAPAPDPTSTPERAPDDTPAGDESGQAPHQPPAGGEDEAPIPSGTRRRIGLALGGLVLVVAVVVAAVTRTDDDLAWLGDVDGLTFVAFHTTEPIDVDGDRGEWPEVPQTWVADTQVVGRGPVVVRGSGWLAWDEDALYLFADVSDENVVQQWHDEPSQLFRGDAVSFEYTSSPSGQAGETVTAGEGIQVLLGPDDGTGNGTLAVVDDTIASEVADDDRIAPDIRIETVPAADDDPGYLLEAAIPWTTLGVAEPEQGAVAGMNVNVHNIGPDDDGRPRSVMTTTPGRTGNARAVSACWGRMVLWDDPLQPPDPADLPISPHLC